MRATRRGFIRLSALAVANVPLGERPSFVFTEQTVKPLRILLLGGTGFTEASYQVGYALSRGRKVTTFNRGTHPGELPNEVEQLIGDRNGQLDALKAQMGRGYRQPDDVAGVGARRCANSQRKC